jgi:lipoprotein-anchoring transpeptidase ErfK/SrfK
LYKGSDTVKKYPVAVGNPPSLTPEGRFKIVIKVVNPMWGGGGYAQPVAGGVPENPLGYRWMGLDLGGGVEYGIHGNNAPYSIGTNASHGCVRMINSDVESLYEIVSVDTPVWIGSEDFLEKNGITQDVYK